MRSGLSCGSDCVQRILADQRLRRHEAKLLHNRFIDRAAALVHAKRFRRKDRLKVLQKPHTPQRRFRQIRLGLESLQAPLQELARSGEGRTSELAREMRETVDTLLNV